MKNWNGLGKTLGLLSASCAWLEKYKQERVQSREKCKACGGGSDRRIDQSIFLSELNDSNLGDNNSKDTNADSAECTSDAQSFPTRNLFFIS